MDIDSAPGNGSGRHRGWLRHWDGPAVTVPRIVPGTANNKLSQTENVVEEAQDAVDAINNRMKQQYSPIEQQ